MLVNLKKNSHALCNHLYNKVTTFLARLLRHMDSPGRQEMLGLKAREKQKGTKHTGNVGEKSKTSGSV